MKPFIVFTDYFTKKSFSVRADTIVSFFEREDRSTVRTQNDDFWVVMEGHSYFMRSMEKANKELIEFYKFQLDEATKKIQDAV